MTVAKPFSYTEFTPREPREPPDGGPAAVARTVCAFTPFAGETASDPGGERRHTDEDLEKAVEEARTRTAIEVEAAVREAVAAELQQRQCELLQAIADRLGERCDAFDRELSAIARASQRLALATATALVPRAIERYPLADIEDLLKTVLERLGTRSSLEIRIAPDLLEPTRALLAELKAQAPRLPADLETVPDTALAPGDLRLIWAGGEIERSLGRLQKEAIGLVEHWLDEPVPPPHEDAPPEATEAAEVMTTEGPETP